MYIVRDIFQLRFGQYKDAKKLLDEAYSNGLLPDARSSRILSDFTGDAYRLIFEEGYESLAEYEQSLSFSMSKPEWKKWYDRFKANVESSHREILKQIM
ncbi:MAG TPA: hypothetical protein VFG10_13695 [Saprospiraceae bacterium]|nr:hypothetical protein [Saprospiraceae bacterium]